MVGPGIPPLKPHPSRTRPGIIRTLRSSGLARSISVRQPFPALLTSGRPLAAGDHEHAHRNRARDKAFVYTHRGESTSRNPPHEVNLFTNNRRFIPTILSRN